MSAADSAAADEFAALQRTQITHISHHPSDEADSDVDSDSETHRPSYRHSKPSLRFGNSRHNNMNEDDDADDDDDDDWDARYGGSSVFAVKDKGYQIPKGEQGRVQGNTGPKGVIADARAAEREKREEKEGARRRGHVRTAERGLEEEEEVGRKWFEDEDESDDDDEDEDEDDEDDDGDGDDSFMKEWRRKRMGEVAAAVARKNNKGNSGSRGKGIVEEVDALGYLEAVDGAARGDVVVVYISDSESSTSTAYLSYLQTLASKYTNTRFISLDYEEAEFEHAGVPALLAYRNGGKFADMVPLRDEVPFTCNVVTNLEEALKRYDIL